MIFNNQHAIVSSGPSGRHITALILMILPAVVFLSSCSLTGNSPYFKSSDDVLDTMENLIYYQQIADRRIEKEIKDSSHTLDDPLVLENPYDTAPLTALIIFRTDDATSIEMTINDSESIRFESSKEHALPVYGLYDDYENRIVLKDEQGNSKELSIKTEKYDGGVLNVEKTSDALSDEFYLISPDYERTSAYDKNGRLLWYLNYSDNEGAVIFLGGGRFLISDPYQGTGGIRINYSGFLEMDYLGKVRRQYISEYGYHHEIVPINGGNEFLVSGHDEESPFMQAVLYTVNAKTMQITRKVDFYDIFASEAPEWTEDFVKDTKFNFVINGFDYDGASGDAVVSVRALGMIIRVNMDSGRIKWIFADPDNVPDPMKKYLLTPNDDTRYPYGQHAAAFMSDGRISYHNNDLDFLNEDQHLSAYKGHYSSNEILSIDEDNKELSTLWTYDGGKKIISKMSGSLEFLPDGHKLLSYGSAVKPEYIESGEDVEINNFNKTEALMMELDRDDNVLWRATFPSVIHKVYRSDFYDKGDNPNYSVFDYELIDGQDEESHRGEEFDIDSASSELKNAKKLNGSFSLLINRAIPESDYTRSDKVEILFIGEDGGGRIFTYKETGTEPPIVNSGRYGIRVSGLHGRQKVYIRISDTWYDSGKIIDFP